jgi:transcriptional regulator with XRE-family HTH domain
MYIMAHITLGEMLYLLRRRAKLTLRELADISGISHSTLWRIEQDEDAMLSNIVAAFEAIGLVLELRLLPILSEEEE